MHSEGRDQIGAAHADDGLNGKDVTGAQTQTFAGLAIVEDVRLLVRAADLYLEGGEKWKGVERLERAVSLEPDDKEIARR